MGTSCKEENKFTVSRMSSLSGFAPDVLDFLVRDPEKEPHVRPLLPNINRKLIQLVVESLAVPLRDGPAKGLFSIKLCQPGGPYPFLTIFGVTEPPSLSDSQCVSIRWCADYLTPDYQDSKHGIGIDDFTAPGRPTGTLNGRESELLKKFFKDKSPYPVPFNQNRIRNMVLREDLFLIHEEVFNRTRKEGEDRIVLGTTAGPVVYEIQGRENPRVKIERWSRMETMDVVFEMTRLLVSASNIRSKSVQEELKRHLGKKMDLEIGN